MLVHTPARPALEKRPALWDFTRLATLRRRLLQRAGRLIRPQRKLTPSMAANPAVKDELLALLAGPGLPRINTLVLQRWPILRSGLNSGLS